MDNDTLEVQTPGPEDNNSVPGLEQMSFTDKIVGLFTEPGNVFDSIRQFPIKVVDWLIPILIMIAFVITSTLIQSNNPAIKSELRQQQLANMQKAVDEGKMTQDQVEKNLDTIEKFKVFGILIGVPIGTFVMMAFMALIYWIIAKYGLGGSPSYGHVFVLMGLTSIFGIIEVIITLALSILMGKSNAAPNLSLLVSSVNSGPMFSILKSIDPISIWSMIVVGIGLGKLSLADTKKSLIWVIGLWIIFILLGAFVFSKLPFMSGM
jgi:hypothetical protein